MARSAPDTPEHRSLIGRIAAHESWAHTADCQGRTAAARAAMDAKFEREVDPNNELPPAERARRAAHLRTAYFSRLALRSAQARARRARLTADEDRLAQELKQAVDLLGPPEGAPP
jgi:hypothetical protein